MKIRFETTNAAFEEDKRGETARILRDVAARVERGEMNGNVRDVNGNTVGFWTFGPTRRAS